LTRWSNRDKQDGVPADDFPASPRAAGRLAIFGCGYAGTAVARHARALGWDVWALTRNAERAAALRASGVSVVQAVLHDPAWHADAPRDRDCVLDCVSASGGGLAGYHEAYVDGMRGILAWAASGVPATFVYTGSTGVYPQARGETVAEDAAVGGGPETAGPLLEAERLVRESACFRRWFILRLAGIYGPGRHFLLDQLRAGATVLPGTGTHRLNLVFLDDIVSAVFACFAAPPEVRDTVLNVAGGEAVRKDEVARWLCERLGRPPPVFAHDTPKLPPGMPVVRGRSGPVPDRVVDAGKIKRLLGWRPRFPGFRDGYERIFAGETAGLGAAGDGLDKRAGRATIPGSASRAGIR
jgi:nucleoside-diphosphate-sugar epimerase